MFRITPIRTFTLLALLSLGGPAVADAAPRPTAHRTPGGARDLESSLWSFFAALLENGDCARALFTWCQSQARVEVSATDEGCGIDPYGQCAGTPQASVSATDLGCGIDPYGQCKK